MTAPLFHSVPLKTYYNSLANTPKKVLEDSKLLIIFFCILMKLEHRIRSQTLGAFKIHHFNIIIRKSRFGFIECIDLHF